MEFSKVTGRIRCLFALSISVTDTSEIYDPETNSWIFGPQLPLALLHSCAAIIDDSGYKILLAGGKAAQPGTIPDDAVTTAQAWIYDWVTDAWTSIASMSVPRQRMGCARAQLAGRDVVALAGGGHTGSGTAAYTSVEVYNIATGFW